jgi:Ni,Fe-hydrogenase I cytochrome b subunit
MSQMKLMMLIGFFMMSVFMMIMGVMYKSLKTKHATLFAPLRAHFLPSMIKFGKSGKARLSNLSFWNIQF